uniref:Uncharacterized protein n=1 Tax=viral metagenome TaxID=1070528 RepID=A0A6C0LRX4_9ZZZZ
MSSNQQLEQKLGPIIKSPQVMYIIITIKKIQARMKDSDMINSEYIRIYDQLSREFNHFFETYTDIFIKVIRGIDIEILASVLYYKDQVFQGLITEEQVADKLAQKYLPKHLKVASDIKLKELKSNPDFMKI